MSISPPRHEDVPSVLYDRCRLQDPFILQPLALFDSLFPLHRVDQSNPSMILEIESQSTRVLQIEQVMMRSNDFAADDKLW